METALTTLAALIASLIGAWVGANFALSRFKKERAFDRQLDWYERVIRSLHDLAQKIEIAVTFQREATEPQSVMGCWRNVQHCHLVLDSIAVEADLYGSSNAAKMTSQIVADVQELANATEAFDPSSWEEDAAEDLLNLVEDLPDKLRTAAKPLADEARRHLGLRDTRVRFSSR